MLHSPHFLAIDVKSTKGTARSLDSCAIHEKDLEYIIKISREMPQIDMNHTAKIASLGLERKIPLVILPHYLSGRLIEVLD